MFGIGMPEMLLILVVALIVVGPKKLPDLAKSVGKAMGEFKRATKEIKESMIVDSKINEEFKNSSTGLNINPKSLKKENLQSDNSEKNVFGEK